MHYFDIILNDVNKNSKKAHSFIYRLAKIDKTFLYKMFYNYFCAKSKIVLYVTFFIIIVLLLLKKITLYLWFKILLNVNKNNVGNIKHNIKLYNLSQCIALFILNKMPMQY